LTVPEAEEILYLPVNSPNGFVRLVDYIGGDDSVYYAATGGKGPIVLSDLSYEQLFDSMHEYGATNGFRFVQLKFHMFMPIQSALYFVYDRHFKVNEYSARYSELLSMQRAVTKQEVEEVVGDEATSHFHSLIGDLQDESRETYEALLNMRLARELSRIVVGSGNMTEFYVCATLDDFLDVIDFGKRRAQLFSPDLGEFSNVIESLCEKVAPLTVKSYERKFKNELNPVASNDLLERVDSSVLNSYPDGSLRYGVSETKRLTVPEAEEVLWSPISYLNNGYFMPTDYMGSDAAIVQAARVSYGAGTEKTSKDESLVRYLNRHKHGTPFEQVLVQGEQKTPIFVFPRQGGRHRMLDREGFLGRFPALDPYYLVPEDEIRIQSEKNKQGRDEELLVEDKIKVVDEISSIFSRQTETCDKLLENGFPAHIVDMLKGVGHYTISTVKTDLRNAFNFLILRQDHHAQKEIRVIADMWADFLERVAPAAIRAYEDYGRNVISFSSIEKPLVKRAWEEGLNEIPLGWYQEIGLATKRGKKRREAEELDEKLKRFWD
jgi:thymidylate synthase (FAD)